MPQSSLMRLLIYTQAVDKRDPILGFFHRWIEEFAKRFECVHVVCLNLGEHSLPKNVTVHSLGKENGESRIKYVFRFFQHLFPLEGRYDAVFVHMNPHYVILGGIYWKIRGIPIFFWRNHAKMNLMTRLAAPFAKFIFHTSPFACTARYAHAIQMPVGIDMKHFYFQETENSIEGRKRILFLGRISPVKRIELFLEVSKLLGSGYEFHVYGDAQKKDQKYAEYIRAHAPDNMFFHQSVRNDETPRIYHSHDVYVNLTPDGSMDKTVLEAVACGTPTVAVNRSFKNVLAQEFIPKDDSVGGIARAIEYAANITGSVRIETLREAHSIVDSNHSLSRLGELLYAYIVKKDYD